jgi:hypothetical protein
VVTSASYAAEAKNTVRLDPATLIVIFLFVMVWIAVIANRDPYVDLEQLEREELRERQRKRRETLTK